MATTTTSTAFFDNPHLLTAIGIGLSIGLSALGSAIGSAHGAVYLLKAPSVRILTFVPIVTAGALAIYGLIIGVILCGLDTHKGDHEITIVDGTKNLAGGAAVGLSCLASGLGMAMFIGRINDGSAASAASPKAASGASAVDIEPLLSEPTTTTVSTANTSTEEVGAYSTESYRKIILANIFLLAIGFYGIIVALVVVQ
jgi:F0F1-type ATP synthase membrane subunit c/vacuolar-type H+-ATPase subunit K